MAQYFNIHPDNPQQRLTNQVIDILRNGGVIAYPTDSCYALGCLSGDKSALDRIIAIRRLDPKHYLTLICRDLSEISVYAKVDNIAYRLIKRLTPGPYTFLLKASKDVPRRLQHPLRKTIGIRIPDNNIVQAIVEGLGEAILSTSLVLPNNTDPEFEPEIIEQKLGKVVDAVIEGGISGYEQTTVVDLTSDQPELVRQGKGEISVLSSE